MTRRLVVGLVAFTLLVLLVSVLPLGLATTARDRRDYRTATLTVARSLASLADEELDRRTGARLRPERFSRAAGPATGVVVLGADRRPVLRTGIGFRPPAALVSAAFAGRSDSTWTRSGDPDAVAAAPVAEGTQVRGAVVVLRSGEPLEQRTTRLWLELVGIAVAALVVAVLLALATARWVGRPLRELAETAQRWSDGDLAERARVRRGPPELRDLGAHLDAMAARLETLVAASRGHLADVSHQLRTPLAAVRLRLDLLRDEVDARAEEDVAAAGAEIDRLSRLVDGLLAVARAESATPAPQPVDVAAVLEERRQAWAPLADERAVILTVEAGTLPPAQATPGTLEQVFDNLIANALDAVRPGGSIRLRAAADHDGRVRVDVVDDGVGMSPDVRRDAFRRFTTGARPVGGAERNGTGLGLAIVHRLVTTDGGSVELHDTPGGGLTVTVELPARR